MDLQKNSKQKKISNITQTNNFQKVLNPTKSIVFP